MTGRGQLESEEGVRAKDARECCVPQRRVAGAKRARTPSTNLRRGGHRPPTVTGLRLAELLAARLCHEVSGPAGTLAGAVEIARTEPASAAEALDIAAKAAASLAGRLRLLRAAWAGTPRRSMSPPCARCAPACRVTSGPISGGCRRSSVSRAGPRRCC